MLKYKRDQCSTTTKHSIHRQFQIFKTGSTLHDPSSDQAGSSPVNNNLLVITCFLGVTLIVILLISLAILMNCIRKEKRRHSQRKMYSGEVAKNWLFGADVWSTHILSSTELVQWEGYGLSSNTHITWQTRPLTWSIISRRLNYKFLQLYTIIIFSTKSSIYSGRYFWKIFQKWP